MIFSETDFVGVHAFATPAPLEIAFRKAFKWKVQQIYVPVSARGDSCNNAVIVWDSFLAQQVVPGLFIVWHLPSCFVPRLSYLSRMSSPVLYVLFPYPALNPDAWR